MYQSDTHTHTGTIYDWLRFLDRFCFFFLVCYDGIDGFQYLMDVAYLSACPLTTLSTAITQRERERVLRGGWGGGVMKRKL